MTRALEQASARSILPAELTSVAELPAQHQRGDAAGRASATCHTAHAAHVLGGKEGAREVGGVREGCVR